AAPQPEHHAPILSPTVCGGAPNASSIKGQRTERSIAIRADVRSAEAGQYSVHAKMRYLEHHAMILGAASSGSFWTSTKPRLSEQQIQSNSSCVGSGAGTKLGQNALPVFLMERLTFHENGQKVPRPGYVMAVALQFDDESALPRNVPFALGDKPIALSQMP